MTAFYTNIATSGNKILLREHDPETGKSTKRRVEFNPSVFIETNEPTGWKSTKGQELKRIEFQGVKDFWDFKKRYSEMGNEIFGDISPQVQYISENYSNDLDVNLKSLRICNIDIETDYGEEFPDPMEAPMEVTAITIYDNQNNIMRTYGLEYEGCGGWVKDKRWKDSKYQFDYRGYDTEHELLNQFLKDWESNHPDIITGWFIDGFDIPYLVNRIEKIVGEGESKRLSPWKQIRELKAKFGRNPTYNILGIATLDYMLAYWKYSYTPQSSYKLDNIAHAELKDRKLSFDEVSGLAELYKTDYQKYIDYNIKDVDIVQRLDDKLGFLSTITSMAYYAQINYDDVSSPVRIWDSIIYNHLKAQGIQIPPEASFSKKEKYAGAFVKEPQVGRHDWTVSFDLTSEYPSIMRGLNISPDTFLPDMWAPDRYTVDELLEKPDLSHMPFKNVDASMAANNTYYDNRKEGFLPILLTELFKGRYADKKVKMECLSAAEKVTGDEKAELKHKAGIYHVRQNTKKVLLNSAYGALGNEYFRWFDVRLAEAVTTQGQLAIQWAERATNEYLNTILDTKDVDYVIYIDTDSIYVNMAPIVEKFMPNETDKTKITDKLSLFSEQKVKKVISNAYEELYEYMNHREQLMLMDREVIADKAIFCTKKHYFMRVYDSEGVRYATPKTKIMGMGFIKSSMPEFCRNHCKDTMVDIAFDGTNVEFSAAIEAFQDEFNNTPLEDIACVTGVSKIKKYMTREGYEKGTPVGSKSSIIYNRLHKKYKLGIHYPKINEGDKIKYLWLNRINPIGEETVGFVDYLPKEFALEQHVDMNLMFEKSFVGPVTEILTAMNWDRKIVTNLNSWFGV